MMTPGQKAAKTRFPTLESFYDADPRRRRSPECDYGVWWRGRSINPKWRISYVQATGEVYSLCMGPEHDVEILAVVPPNEEDIYYRTLEALLDGWADHCGRPDGIAWVRDRLASYPIITGR